MKAAAATTITTAAAAAVAAAAAASVLLPSISFSIAFRSPVVVLERRLVSSSIRYSKGRGPQQPFFEGTARLQRRPTVALAARGGGGGDDDDNSRRKSQTFSAAVQSGLDMSISWIGSTTSAVVSVAFFAVLAWRRDALMVTFFFGSIGNSVLSKLLKKIINQTRPEELASSQLSSKPTDNGMPSSHAMSLGFIATYTALCLPWTAAPLLFYTFISLYYRINVNLHTWQQVVVGLTLGSVNGYLWHRACHDTTTLLDWVRGSFLFDVQTGRLPLPLLIVPMIVGAVTVGSLERRWSDLVTLVWRRPSTTKGEHAGKLS